MDFFKDHNHKRLFQLLLLSVLALFLSLLSNQAVMAVVEGYCIGENCIYNWWGNGTTDYIARWTGLNSLGDSAIYQSGSNIGIGTITPAQKLHVAGYARADSGFCIGTSCITAWPQGEVTGSGTANYVPLWTTSSNIGNSAIYQSGSRIGIGTTSPSQLLTVQGTDSDLIKVISSSDVGASISLESTGLNGSTWSIISTANEAWGGGGNLGFINNSFRLYVKADGNVGIGTTSPAQKLHVNGYARADSGFCIGTSCITAWPQGEVTGSGTANYIPRWTTGSNVGNSVIYQSGSNIGIGTVSPGAKLETAGGRTISYPTPGTSKGDIHINSTGINDDSSSITFGSNSGSIVNSAQAGIYVQGSGAYGTKMYFSTTNAHVTGSQARMMIDSVGNVGIGTTSPAQKLHVAGYARADSGFCIGTSCITAWPQGEVTGSGTANYIPRWTTGSNVGNSVIYQSGSNIGIGTVSPGGKLEILQNMSDYGTAFTAPHLNLGAANTLDSVGFVGVTYDASTSNNYGWSAGALRSNNGQSSFVWKYHNNSAAGVERVRIDESGNIGISTTSPAQKLHVAGYARADSGFCIGTSCITAWPQGEVTGSGTANYIPRWTTSSNIGNSVIYQSGSNIGIGTTSPGSTLDVAGNININEVSAYLYDGVQGLKLTKGTDTFYANTFVGHLAGEATTARQTAVGHSAGAFNTGGYQTALGYYAGSSNTGASQTALGYRAGHLNTGNDQTAVGHYAGYSNTGSYQTAVGLAAGNANIGASQTALGYYAGTSNTGSYQTAVGYTAGQANTGTHQTALGYYAGYYNSGHQVTGVGYEATRDNTANDVVAIGYQAGKGNAVANQFIIKQANINATPLIQGDFLSGNVGIGTTSPQEKLDVNGNVRANEYYYSSDISLKTGIGYLPGEETLSKVLKLQGVSFKWKESGKSSIGFIAQDVEKIFPELVNTDQNGLKSIQYGNLIAPLVESIKEQQKQIEQLRQEIEELKR